MLLVDVQLAVPDGPRWHARHRWRGGTVDAVLVRDEGGAATSTSYAAEEWQGELARLLLELPGAAHEQPPPAERVELPHDLLLGTGAALADHRSDVFHELVRRGGAAVCLASGVPTRAEAEEQLRRLHGSVTARLLAVGSATAGPRRRLGWVSWLRYADGWRALTPYVDDGVPMVRVEPRRPADLGVEVARWAVGASAPAVVAA